MDMKFTLKSGITGFTLLCSSVVLMACSDSGNAVSDPGTNESQNGVQTTGLQDNSGSSTADGSDTAETGENNTQSTAGDTEDGAHTGDSGSDDSGSDDSGTGDSGSGDSDTGDSDTDASGTGDSGSEDTTGAETGTTDGGSGGDGTGGQTTAPESTENTVEANAAGSDASGGQDDSPTATETASLVGPFIKDTSRSPGPPSVPEGLTLLMSGENFVEFSWIPSTDDQSVEAYEIYRDGQLVYTLSGLSTYEFDYKSWITTSYMDCNYTRYTNCGDNPIAPGSSYSYQVAAIDNEGMKSALSAPVVMQMAQRQSGSANLSGYSQVFSEEFEGDSLDRSKWKTALPWGENKIINSERQYFVNIFGSDPLPVDPFVFNGSTLKITGSITPTNLLSRANNQPYLSGVITTSDNFKMTYGYVEMSAKVTSGEGFLSTFYLFNQDFEKNKPEIDIIEYIGSRPDKAYQTYHYYDSNRNRWATGERHSTPTMETQYGSDLGAGFHTYSVLWEPGLIVWYIDGSEVRRITGVRVSDEPMNIIAQLVVGSEWIGEPDAASLPKTFEIDYIRAWQKQ